MNLTEAYLLLFVLLAVVAVLSVFFKNRIALVAPLVFVVCAIVTLLAGMGVRVREIVEGPFAYLDNAMQILAGAAFVFLLYHNGTLEYIFQKIVGRKRGNVLQLLFLTLFVALPAMLTGVALTSVLSTGLMVGKYLMDKGADKAKAVEVVAVGSPLCMPTMLTVIAHGPNGYLGSFEGYFVPCLVIALPALVVYCAISGRRILEDVQADPDREKAGGPVCLVPLIVVALLLISHNFLYFIMPFLGYPLIYTIGFILAVFLKAKSANPLTAAAEGMRSAAPELVLMYAFASVTEVLTLVGSVGTISAQFALATAASTLNSATTGTFLAVGLCVLVLIAGTFFGPALAVCIAAAGDFLLVEALYGNTEMAMFGLGAVLAISMFTSLRGGIVDLTSQALGADGVSGKSVVVKNVIPVILVCVVAVVYIVARVAAKALMI